MPANTVIFIDTSVLNNLLQVPGRCDDFESTREKFRKLRDTGAKFILPITALIETGNFVSQSGGDRRAAAERFDAAILSAMNATPPWVIRDVLWDKQFLDELRHGAGTKVDLVDHFSRKTMGAGDLAIVVEMNQFVQQTNYSDVRIWTLDSRLQAHASAV